MKTAKIKQVQNSGMAGQWYKFEYFLDDGYSGFAYSKKNTPFGNPGDVIEYESDLDKNGFPKINIKNKIAGPSVNADAERVNIQKQNTEINKDRADFDKQKQILIIRQSSLKAAVDFCVNRGTPYTYQNVLELADIFTHYAMTGNHPDITDNEPPF